MSTINVQSITNGTDSISVEDSIKSTAKAWINFDGNSMTERDKFNVSSITDTGTGQYTVFFTTPMQNTNYAFFLSRNRNSNDAAIVSTAKATGSISVRTVSETFQGLDVTEVNVLVYSL